MYYYRLISSMLKATVSSLLTGLYAVYKAEANNNLSLKNAWNGNGDAVDSKGTANGTIVTPNSTTGYTTSSMTYSTGKLGTSCFTFNGSNFVSLPNNTFTFTSDFTVSLWFYVPTDYVSNAYLVSAFDNQQSYPTYFGWMIGYDTTNNNIGFYICRNDMGQYYTLGLTTANSTIVKNQWNHITITRKSSTRSRIYINGVLSTSNTSTINPVYNTEKSSIGSAYYAFSYPFWKGANAGLKIDAVQTWDGAELDQTAVTELYNSGNGQEYPFTLSNVMIPSASDSLATYNGTAQGGLTYTTGKSGNAFTFNGTNAFVRLPDNAFNSLTGDFSVSSWVYIPSVYDPGTTLYIVQNMGCDAWFNNPYGWRFFMYGDSLYFTIFNHTNTYYTLAVNYYAYPRNSWTHVAVSRKGSTGSKLYINGSLVASDSNTVNPLFYANNITPTIGNLYMGTNGSIQNSYFAPNGTKVDELNIWNKELTSTEVAELYNAGTGKFYPY